MRKKLKMRMAVGAMIVMLGMTGCQAAENVGGAELESQMFGSEGMEMVTAENRGRADGAVDAGNAEAMDIPENRTEFIKDFEASYSGLSDEELLFVCWRQAIEGLSGAPMNSNFILCLPEISAENVERAQINYFTHSTTKTKGKYIWNGSELVWKWRFANMASCTESTYEQITSESMLLMRGAVSCGDNGSKVGKEVCHAALGYAGKLYQERNGSVEGSWYAVAYLMDYNNDETAPQGECWIRIGEDEFIKVTVTYAPEAEPLDGSEFTFEVEENAVFSDEIESEALTICSLNLTTEKPGADENAWMSNAWDRFDEYGDVWQAKLIGSYSEYMDRLGDEAFPAMDYDGDGLTDRIYRHYVNFGEYELWLFFGDGETILLCDEVVSGSNRESLEALDITGDGKAELIYKVVIYANGAGHDNGLIGIWTETEGKWHQMPMWGAGESALNSESLLQLYIPLEIEKLNENELRATQPDTGATGTIWVSDEIMKSTWISEQDSVCAAIKSSNLWLIQDPQTGAWKLHADGAWGHQGEWIEVGWELIYQDGQWVLDDCAVESDANLCDHF